MIGWYLSKADQCLLLAHEATNPADRLKFETEGRHWREIAAEIEAAQRKAIAKLQQG